MKFSNAQAQASRPAPVWEEAPEKTACHNDRCHRESMFSIGETGLASSLAIDFLLTSPLIDGYGEGTNREISNYLLIPEKSKQIGSFKKKSGNRDANPAQKITPITGSLNLSLDCIIQ